jgi:hypothetical protein
MAIANVTLLNTFDEWRTTTNQLIGVYEETNTLAVASFNKANSVTQDAANVAAGVLASNTLVIETIANSTNILLGEVYNTVNGIYNIANTANIQSANAESNATIARSQSANAQSNATLALANSLLAVSRSANAESNATIAIYNSANAESNATIALYKASNAESNIITFTANVSQEVANILSSNAEFTNTVNTVAVSIINNYIATSPINAAFDTANTARSEALAFAIALG